MASALAWQHVADAQSSHHVAPKAAPASLRNLFTEATIVLPALNRLRSSKDFARVTKTGYRATTASLVLYLRVDAQLHSDPQVGLIVSKVVGGSVTRHRIARQLRHAAHEYLREIPPHSHLVVRVIKGEGNYREELREGLTKLSKKEAKK